VGAVTVSGDLPLAPGSVPASGDSSGPGSEPPGYELWRQDDNGNRYLVSVHADRAGADAALDDLERGVVHKQLYFVKERGVKERGVSR
jgi:hypothetical protein